MYLDHALTWLNRYCFKNYIWLPQVISYNFLLLSVVQELKDRFSSFQQQSKEIYHLPSKICLNQYKCTSEPVPSKYEIHLTIFHSIPYRISHSNPLPSIHAMSVGPWLSTDSVCHHKLLFINVLVLQGKFKTSWSMCGVLLSFSILSYSIFFFLVLFLKFFVLSTPVSVHIFQWSVAKMFRTWPRRLVYWCRHTDSLAVFIESPVALATSIY